MDTQHAKRLVVLSTATIVGSSALATYNRGEVPSARLAVGGFATGIMLAILAEVWPAGAGGIALVAMSTALFVYGRPAWTAVANITNRDPEAKL